MDSTKEDHYLPLLNPDRMRRQPQESEVKHIHYHMVSPRLLVTLFLILVTLIILHWSFPHPLQYLSTESEYHGFYMSPPFKCATLLLMLCIILSIADCCTPLPAHPFCSIVTKRQHRIFMRSVHVIGIILYIYSGTHTSVYLIILTVDTYTMGSLVDHGKFILLILITPFIVIFHFICTISMIMLLCIWTCDCCEH